MINRVAMVGNKDGRYQNEAVSNEGIVTRLGPVYYFTMCHIYLFINNLS